MLMKLYTSTLTKDSWKDLTKRNTHLFIKETVCANKMHK